MTEITITQLDSYLKSKILFRVEIKNIGPKTLKFINSYKFFLRGSSFSRCGYTSLIIQDLQSADIVPIFWKGNCGGMAQEERNKIVDFVKQLYDIGEGCKLFLNAEGRMVFQPDK